MIHTPVLLAALWTVAPTVTPPTESAAPPRAADDDGIDADGDGFIDATQALPADPPITADAPSTAPAPSNAVPSEPAAMPGSPAPPSSSAAPGPGGVTPPSSPSPSPLAGVPAVLPLGPTSTPPSSSILGPSTPAPSPDLPLSTNAPSPDFPPPTPEQRGIVIGPSSAPKAPPPAADGGTLGDHLVWYAADYVAVLLAGGLVASGVLKDVAPAPASIGPRFALDKPDLAVLFDPRLDDVIGRPMVREKVPTAAVAAAAAVAALGTAAVDLAGGGNLHRTHALLLGSTEALLGTVVVTEVLKLSFGRLRPDFRDRWLRAACADNVPSPAALDCTSVADGFVVSRADVLDGMKSFPSGHTSSSFALLSFSTLAIGSRWIWGDDAPAWAQPVAGLVIGALAAGAGFTAASRQSDGRHHAEDVAVGAAVGTAIGASTWLVHFDTRGRARTRWPVRLAPTTMTSAAGPAPGLALTGSFG